MRRIEPPAGALTDRDLQPVQVLFDICLGDYVGSALWLLAQWIGPERTRQAGGRA